MAQYCIGVIERVALVEDNGTPKGFRRARERQVLQALAEGLDSKEIASKLRITVETERTHMVNILNKLGVHSRLQALVFAARNGLVEIR